MSIISAKVNWSGSKINSERNRIKKKKFVISILCIHSETESIYLISYMVKRGLEKSNQ
jgi:hypothetical protein